MHLPIQFPILAAVTSLAFASPADAAIVYVNAAQNLPLAAQDGTSWATAYQQLYDALTEEPGTNDFWIATGVYKPTPTNDRTQRFLLNQSQKVYGGFLPGATTLAERDPAAHPTILSGDVGVPGVSTDNSFQVLQIQNAGASLDGLIIEDSNSFGTVGGSGGGIKIVGASAFSLDDCVVRRCVHSGRGGAIGLVASNGFFRNCSFEQNSAGNAGGAIDVQSTTARFANCRFVGNVGESGGGLFLLGGLSVTVQNCVFSGNAATAGFGGGIDMSSGPVTITGCTFANNTASNAGGGLRISFANASNQITNCLFAGNTAPLLPQISATAGSPILHNGFSNAPFAGTGNVVVAAEFVDANGADNVIGTADDDLHLKATSGAIDHGCGTLLSADVCDLDGDSNVAEPLPVDIDGQPRLTDDFAANTGLGGQPFLDFGAHEFNRPYRVICVNGDVNGGNDDGSSWDNAFKRLQDAILFAMTTPQTKPVELWVAQGTYLPTDGNDRSVSFAPQGNLTVLGGFKGNESLRSQRSPSTFPTILSGAIGNSGFADNSFHVVRFAGDNVFEETILDGFFITDGNASGNGNDEFGGGMLVSGIARPTVRNCRFIGNHAGAGGGGLAVVDSGSGPVTFNCYLAGNSAARGGAIYLASGSDHTTIVNATIAGNEADQTGGLFAADRGTLVSVLNTIFFENVDAESESDATHLLAANGAIVKLGYSALPCAGSTVSGDHLIALPPRFKDLPGDDGIIGTLDDLLLLGEGSPCIDAGGLSFATASVPQDVIDVDEDGDFLELHALDSDETARIVDDASMPNADPDLAIDIGADEANFTDAGPANPADLNDDGHVNGADLAILLGSWGGYNQAFDLNGDCTVSGADLAVLLGGWTG